MIFDAISTEYATEYAKRLARALDFTFAEERILGILLSEGPSIPAPRSMLGANSESKSGEVILGRLRRKLAERGWTIETCYPNGVRITDLADTRRIRDAADGYAFSHATFEQLVALAADLPPTPAPPSVGA